MPGPSGDAQSTFTAEAPALERDVRDMAESVLALRAALLVLLAHVGPELRDKVTATLSDLAGEPDTPVARRQALLRLVSAVAPPSGAATD